jgi:hypothetical protein
MMDLRAALTTRALVAAGGAFFGPQRIGQKRAVSGRFRLKSIDFCKYSVVFTAIQPPGCIAG